MREIGLILIGFILGLILFSSAIGNSIDSDIEVGFMERNNQVYLIKPVDVLELK